MTLDQAAGPAPAAEETAARLDALLGEVDECADPRLRELGHELVRTLMRLYGAGLARIIAAVPPATARELATDELVAGLLALHDLHPDDLTPDELAPAPAAGPASPDGRRLLPLTPVSPATRRPAVAASAGAGP